MSSAHLAGQAARISKRMRVLLTAILFSSLIAITGCAGVSVEDYKDNEPKLKIEEYFQGDTKAWGVFQDFFGKVRRQFVVDIDGTWDEDNQQLTLVEDFVYNDGKTEQRIWTITKTGENTYEGTAGGVVGTAKGKSAGNAFNFNYTFDLPYKGDTLRVTFDDWMYLQDKTVLFNKATIKKYGIPLGDVYIFFDKDVSASVEDDIESRIRQAAE